MAILKYTVIKSIGQYDAYCLELEQLLDTGKEAKFQDEIELLTVLIEKWDAEHNTFDELDPVQLLKALMEEHQLIAANLVEILGISKGYVSDILHYKKGMSKENIRKLATHFKVSQEAFNRPYPLQISSRQSFRKAG